MHAIILVDNDVLLKLARYDLLDAYRDLVASEFRNYQFYVLSTAKFKLMPRNDRLKYCGNGVVADRLEYFIASASVVNEALVDLDILEVLNAIPGIDTGEALLISAVIRSESAFLMSGDKKAVAALSHDDVLPYTAALDCKIYIMEEVVRGLISLNFKVVQISIRSSPSVDSAMSNVFGRAHPTDQDGVKAGLASYIQHAQRFIEIKLGRFGC
ncbi:hypothetical protein ACQKEF_23645 [Pseudomonas oryzihabitans]|uniref:hypothetical protein n=1 Tax=Pseudomonas oryzihabitans TaxID=47885 RepID=UPI003D05628B